VFQWVIHSVRAIVYRWVEMKGTLKSFREQQRMIINLLELFGEPAFLPAEYD